MPLVLDHGLHCMLVPKKRMMEENGVFGIKTLAKFKVTFVCLPTINLRSKLLKIYAKHRSGFL